MEIKKRSKNKKLFIIAAAVILIGVAAFLTYYFVYKPHNNNASSTTTSSTNTDKQQADNLHTNPETKNEAPNADKPAAPTTSTTSSKKQVQVTASTDTSGGTIYIRGGINYPVTDGTCYAQLTGPSGQSVRKDTTLLPNPASTDCKTISIPASELASGKWTFTLHYTSNDYEGVSNEVSFSV